MTSGSASVELRVLGAVRDRAARAAEAMTDQAREARADAKPGDQALRAEAWDLEVVADRLRGLGLDDASRPVDLDRWRWATAYLVSSRALSCAAARLVATVLDGGTLE